MEENLNTGCLMLSVPMMKQVVERMHEDLEIILFKSWVQKR